MRWLSLILVLLTATADAQIAFWRPSVPPTVCVLPFQPKGAGAPSWLSTNLQSALIETGQQAPDFQVQSLSIARISPEYAVTGDFAMDAGTLILRGQIIDVASMRIVGHFQASGAMRDLIQHKDAFRIGFLETLGALAGRPQYIPAPQPAVAALPAQPIPTLDPALRFEGSSLQWALDNPDEYSRQLDYISRHRIGRNYGPHYPANLGAPYSIYPGAILTPYNRSFSGSSLGISGSYHGKKWGFQFRLGAGQTTEVSR